jgi:hypothetical protein
LRVLRLPGFPGRFDLLLRGGGIIKAGQLDLFTPLRQFFIDPEEGLQPLLLDFRQIGDGLDVVIGGSILLAGTAMILSSFSPPSIILRTPIGRSLISVPGAIGARV